MMGCRATEDERKDTIGAVTKAASTIPNVDDDKPIPTSSVKKATGGVLPVAYHPAQLKARYVDEHTGERPLLDTGRNHGGARLLQ